MELIKSTVGVFPLYEKSKYVGIQAYKGKVKVRKMLGTATASKDRPKLKSETVSTLMFTDAYVIDPLYVSHPVVHMHYAGEFRDKPIVAFSLHDILDIVEGSIVVCKVEELYSEDIRKIVEDYKIELEIGNVRFDNEIAKDILPRLHTHGKKLAFIEDLD